jgi:hypothetical protein
MGSSPSELTGTSGMTDLHRKKTGPIPRRRPVRDAIASSVNIRVFPIVPASQQRRFPFDSISLCRRDSESALGKSFLLFTRLSELAPSGAWVEGLIQAARCRTKMPDRIVGARLWRAILARWTVLSCHELPPCLGRVLTGAHRFHSSGPLTGGLAHTFTYCCKPFLSRCF